MGEKSLYFIRTESHFVRVFLQFCTHLGKNIADMYFTHHLEYL